MSIDIQERLRDLRTALPFEVSLLGTLMGTSRDEAKIQQQFAAIRLKGEWFKRTQVLLDFIANECQASAIGDVDEKLSA